jgi:hypothetical protein
VAVRRPISRRAVGGLPTPTIPMHSRSRVGVNRSTHDVRSGDSFHQQRSCDPILRRTNAGIPLVTFQAAVFPGRTLGRSGALTQIG